ncbi:PRD domain-containing protein [Ornithinibacillus gellani]|uniref:BglG family transcription antiterminator n=1 Tax=Ornithinibacillus gellani TaxID=2293253 RepID=UPI000F46C173|nr:PRD domain-containing protein [Ornithinibacillus gellani]TQS76010.1 PRD domain-containing protein [Ornithinibacillus gellani]
MKAVTSFCDMILIISAITAYEEVFILFDITTRQAKLIELMASKQGYAPAKYYADLLEVSERTIFNDLAKLEGIFQSVELVVDKKPNQGIKLTGELQSSGNLCQHIRKLTQPDEVPLYSPFDRQIQIVKWLLLENQTLTYQSMSLDLYVSSTSIIKDLDKIKRLMKDEVTLISDIKGTRVKGTEIDIQKTLKRFAYHVIEQSQHNFSIASYAKNMESLFDRKAIQAVRAAMEELVSVLGSEISEQYLKSLFICLLILTERSYQGHHLQQLPKVDLKGATELTNYPLAIQISHSISSTLNFTFTEMELRYISNQLFAHRVEVKVNNPYIENLFTKDIRHIISEVSAAMDINLTKDEKLYDTLIYHMFPMIYRVKSGIAVYNPLLTEIKTNYGILFRMIWYVMESFEKKYGIKLSEDEVAFITIHFQVAMERIVKMTDILVVCQTGIVTSDLIISRIKRLLPANIRFKLIAKPYLQQENLTKVDFIISSVQLPKVACPVVYVSPLVRDADLMNIYSYYLEYSSTRQEETDKLEVVEPSNYFDERYIFLQEDVDSKDACLDHMLDRLEDDDIVKHTFRQSVYEREMLGNTIIQQWIAVPHGQQAMVNETKIAMMTTKQPVKWSEDAQVSFIILLAVAEKDIGNIRQLLGYLYKNIIQSKTLNRDIKNITNSQALLNLFKG